MKLEHSQKATDPALWKKEIAKREGEKGDRLKKAIEEKLRGVYRSESNPEDDLESKMSNLKIEW